MRIIMSFAGRGTTFDIARELLKRGHLLKFITSYPAWAAEKYGLPRKKIASVVTKEILERGWQKLPLVLKKHFNPQFFIHTIYDRLAARHITESDLAWFWTGFGLHSMRRAQYLGAKTIIELGNAPMRLQRQILEEEYAIWHIKPQPFNLPHPKVIEIVEAEYKETNYFSAPSLYIKHSLMAIGVPEEKIVYLPYGVNLKIFHQVKKEDNVFRVIFAGGLCLRKGVHYLIQACAELNLPHFELLLLGGLNDEIKTFFKKYTGHYRWLGHQPQSELYKLYSQGSVFVLNSLDDGFGAVLPQVMACGLPIIGTTSTGTPDLIENGKEGFIIPVRNIEALKEKILFLYEHQDVCQAMGEAARRKVEQGLTWHEYGERVTTEFQKILKR